MKIISKKTLKNLIFPIIGFVFIISFFTFLFNIKTEKENLNWQKLSKEITIGEVTSRVSGNKGSMHALLTFTVNNKVYEQTIESSYVKGEKFKVEYSIINPENSKVLRDYPIFVEGEKTNLTIGKLTNYNSSIFRDLIFEYWVDNKNYIDSQYMKKNSTEIYPNISENQLFVVEYWKKNPRRSIIYLDKPIDYVSEWWNLKLDKEGNIIRN